MINEFLIFMGLVYDSSAAEHDGLALESIRLGHWTVVSNDASTTLF